MAASLRAARQTGVIPQTNPNTSLYLSPKQTNTPNSTNNPSHQSYPTPKNHQPQRHLLPNGTFFPDLLACCGSMMEVARQKSPQSRTSTPLPLSLDNTVSTPALLPTQLHEDGPKLLHSVKHSGSILSLAVSNDFIYAGTQNGEILVWCNKIFELRATVKGHHGSILSLTISKDQTLLFSTGGDAIVNIWDAKTLKIIYSIYSTYDVGDVFCLAYSACLKTVYFGAQNTCIQWCNLDASPRNTLTAHPSRRNHRFFDSKGPGGRSTPRPASSGDSTSAFQGATFLEVDATAIVQYAHYGFVYCMQLVKGLGGTDGEILISGGGDGDVKLWQVDSQTSELIEWKTLEGNDMSVLSIAVKETFLYCGLTDGDINIWDLETFQMIRSVKAHQSDVLTISVSGNTLISGSAKGNSKQWNDRFECVHHWQTHEGLLLTSVVTTRDDNILYFTGGNDETVSAWLLESPNVDHKSPIQSQNDALLSALGKFVGFRTVSGNPAYAEDCRRGAAYLKSLFKRFGARTELLPVKDNRNPVVFARFRGSNPTGRKTILFYGHYDVIHAEESAKKWSTDPFSLTGVNGYLYGRGVSDNKGPCLAALFAVAELVQEQQLESDIVFLVEGEEESGSRGFAEAVKDAKDVIGDVDWILLANSYWLDNERPCLTYGMRGVIHASVRIESDKPDLHSGVDGSRLNHEPTIDLVNLLARLSGVDGNIRIPGFYDPVRPVTVTEEAMYSAIVENHLKNDPTLDAAALKDRLMSKWRFPSHTIHRINVSGPANATVIPRSASASISIRIVPDQDLQTIKSTLTSYLHSEFATFNSNNTLTITIDHEAEPWLGDPQNEAFKTLEDAIEDVWGEGVKPLYIREGGSIPSARFLEREFGAPAAHLPCGQASDHAHLDNERLRLTNLYKSKAILKKFFRELPKK